MQNPRQNLSINDKISRHNQGIQKLRSYESLNISQNSSNSKVIPRPGEFLVYSRDQESTKRLPLDQFRASGVLQGNRSTHSKTGPSGHLRGHSAVQRTSKKKLSSRQGVRSKVYGDLINQSASMKDLPRLTTELRTIRKPQNSALRQSASTALLSDDRSFLRPASGPITDKQLLHERQDSASFVTEARNRDKRKPARPNFRIKKILGPSGIPKPNQLVASKSFAHFDHTVNSVRSPFLLDKDNSYMKSSRKKVSIKSPIKPPERSSRNKGPGYSLTIPMDQVQTNTKEIKFLPLELYDPMDDPMKPKDFLDSKRSEEEDEVKGYSKWFYCDGTFTWEPCTVVRFDKITDRFEIKWASGKLKQVSRLNLRFENEDEITYNKRREIAEENRDRAELFIKYNIMIDETRVEIGDMSVRMTETILKFVKGRVAQITKKNYRNSIEYLKRPPKLQHIPTNFLWTSCKTHNLIEPFRHLGLRTHEELRQKYLNEIEPFILPGWSFRDSYVVVKPKRILSLVEEVDKDYKRTAAIHVFELDLPFNDENCKTFGKLMKPELLLPVQERFRKQTDRIGVAEKLDYPYLKRLTKLDTNLHISWPDSLPILRNHYNALSDFSEYRLFPKIYPNQLDISTFERLLKEETVDLIRELRHIMFDSQYEITDILTTANDARKKRNEAKLATRAFAGQYIEIEEDLPYELLNRMTKLMNLCNLTFERTSRECLEKSLDMIHIQLEDFQNVLVDTLPQSVTHDILVEDLTKVSEIDEMLMPVDERFTIMCSLKFEDNFSIVPDPEDCIKLILDLINKTIEDMKKIPCMECDYIGPARNRGHLKIINNDIIIIDEAYETIESWLYYLEKFPSSLLNNLDQYEYIKDLSVKKYKKKYKKESRVEDFARDLKHLYDTLESIRTILYHDDILYFGLFQVDIKETKANILAKVQECYDLVMEMLLSVIQDQVATLEKQQDEVYEIIGHDPVNLEELDEMKKFLANPYDERILFIKKNARNLTAMLAVLDEYQVKLELDIFERAVDTYATIRRLTRYRRECERAIRRCQKVFAEQLKKSQADMLDDIDTIFDEIQELKKEEEIEKYEDVSFQFGVLKEKIETKIEESLLINSRENLVGSRPTNYRNLEVYKRDFTPYCRLWFFVKDFRSHHPKWMRGQINDLNRDTLQDEIQTYEIELAKLERNSFKDSPQGLKVTRNLIDEVDEFKPYLPLIIALRNPGLRERHWDDISNLSGIKLTKAMTNTLQELLDEGIMPCIEKIVEISDKATRELALENAKFKMETEWDNINFTLTPFKDSGSYILIDNETIWDILDDHLMKTISMCASPYIKFMQRDMDVWRQGLVRIQEILEEWEYCQKIWMYLYPIFSHKDIAIALPQPSQQFQSVHSTWELTMKTTNVAPSVMEVCLGQGKVLEQLKFCTEKLDQILKSLNEFLNSKRVVFPRFYFLANEELLAILSNSRDVKSVQKYMIKCFEGINSLQFDYDLKITGMASPEGEQVDFNKSIPTFTEERDDFGNTNKSIRNVEEWLIDVEEQMFGTLSNLTLKCLKDQKDSKRTKWIASWPAQMIHAVNNMTWTSMTEAAILQGVQGLETFYRSLEKQLNIIVEMVRSELSILDRITLGTLVILEVHNKDTVQSLLSSEISDISDFEWLSQFRYYMEAMKLVTRMIDTERMYGYEYLGSQNRLVITPLTDRCYRTLMGALYLNLGGAPEGPAGTGKTETTKDLAKSIGKKCIVFNCSDRLDHASMGKMFIGLCRCGAWACFDEFNRIDQEVLSVIAEQILTIQNAVMKKYKTFQFDQAVIPIDPTIAIFITMNPGYAGRSELPDNLKALFRPVAMMVPEYSMIAEIQLYSYGFKIARSLAIKLVTSLRLASEQLSDQTHYDYGMRAIIAIVKTAGSFKRQDIDEDENKIVLRAINDTNISKFVQQDIPLFQGIIADLFPDVEASSSVYFLQGFVKIAAEEQGIERNEFMLNKVRQLYICMQVRHGIMLVGEAMSSKTTVLQLLKSALIAQQASSTGFLALASQRSSSRSRPSDRKNNDYVLDFTLNPKAVSLEQLYGEMDEVSHDWIDGLISYRMRECAENTQNILQWIIFDGPVDAIWIESMNTVLDDNKKLCLTSGEIIQVLQKMTLMFEVENLNQASPATVSRCGMIYLEASEALNWSSLVYKWLRNLPVIYDTENYIDLIRQFLDYFLPPIIVACADLQPYAPIKSDTNWLVSSFLLVFEAQLLDAETREGMRNRIADEQFKEEQRKREEEEKARRELEQEQEESRSSFVAKDKKALSRKSTLMKQQSSSKSMLQKQEEEVKRSKVVKVENEQLSIQQKVTVLSRLMFAITWSFGSIFDDTGREKFNVIQHELFKKAIGMGSDPAEALTLVKGHAKAYHGKDVYSMNFEEGKWVSWNSKIDLDKLIVNNLSTLLVPTVDTVRYAFLIEHLSSKDLNLLVTGPTGTGKTVIIRKLLNSFDPGLFSTILTMLSGQSSCNSTQDIIDSKINKRKKGVFGPDYGKKCMIFIDDLNMPEKEQYGAQPAIEILRQAIDKKSWYDRKTWQLKILEDLVFIGAMGHPGSGRTHISHRFMHHMILLNATEFSTETLTSIYQTILERGMENYMDGVLIASKNVANATIALYKDVLTQLPPTPTKSHYTFNLRDLSEIILGILSCPAPKLLTMESLYRLWYHECLRVFSDRLVSDIDTQLLSELLKGTLQMYMKIEFRALCPDGEPFFCNLFPDGMYQECDDISKAKENLEMALEDYNIKATVQMNLVLFKFAVQHVARISRVIANPYGNALLIGVGGVGRQSLSKLATIMMKYEIYMIEITKAYGIEDWKSDLKKLMTWSGIENKKISFIITDSHIKQDTFLENIDSLINSGEVPNLYGSEEKDSVLDRMLEKRGMSIKNEMERWEEYCSCIRMNLHVVLCMSPIGDTLRNRLRKFPSLVNCCTINCFTEWPMEALEDVSRFYFETNKLCEQKLYSDAVKICSHFHTTVIDLSRKYNEELRRYNYVTPTNFLQLLSTIKSTLGYKEDTMISIKMKYERGVCKLDDAQSVVDKLKEELENLQPILIDRTNRTMAIMEEIEIEQAEADKTREVVAAEQQKAAKQAETAEDIQAECENALAVAEPELLASILALKTLKKSEMDEVKSLQKPPTMIRMTLEAVAIMYNAKPIKVYDKMDRSKHTMDYYEAGKKMMNNPKLIKYLENFDRDSILPETIERLTPLIEDKKFVPDIVKKASAAAEGLCKWVRAMFNFYHINMGIRPKKEALIIAKDELTIKLETLKVKQEELDKIEKEISILRDRFDGENFEKQKLVAQINECEIKLERAEKLTASLGSERDRWDGIVRQMSLDMVNLFGDVLLSAGTVSYLGAFMSSYRNSIITDSWIPFIKETRIRCGDTFRLRQVLGDELAIQSQIIAGLPDDTTSIENALIIKRSSNWPLIIDPQKQANKWIRKSNAGEKIEFTKPSNADFLTVLENALFTGSVLLLESVSEFLDPVLEPVLAQQIELKNGVKYIKVGDTLKQYDEDFKLYMTSNLPNPHFTPEISTKVTIINFTITKHGLREQLRTILCEIECPKETEEKKKVLVQTSDHRRILAEQEQKILSLLQQAKGNLLDDEVVINSLTECKNISEEVEKKLAQSKAAELRIEQIQESYNSVAAVSSILYFTVADLAHIDFMYEFSLEWFASQYKKAIEKSLPSENIQERCNNLIRTFKKHLFDTVSSSLFEKDKLIFAFLLCTQLMQKDKKQDQVEWKYLLAGVSGKEAQEHERPEQIEERLWQQILDLSTVPFFSQLPVHVSQNAIAWESYINGKRKDNTTTIKLEDLVADLPEPYNQSEHCSPVQWLILMRVFAPELMIPAIRSFIKSEAGEEYLNFKLFDLKQFYDASTNLNPLIFILSPGNDPLQILGKFADDSRKQLQIISLGKGQGERAANSLEEWAKHGGWVLLQNCHLAPSWMPELELIIEKLSDAKNQDFETNPEFRLWLTLLPSRSFPVSILQNGIKIVIEPPRGIKNNMTRIYNTIATSQMDFLFYESCKKPQPWRKMFFGLAFFHTLIRERRKFGPLGWNVQYEFNESDFRISMRQLNVMLSKYEKIPYSALLYLTGECNYGGRVTDLWDVRILSYLLSDFYNDDILYDHYRFSSLPQYFAPADSLYIDDYIGYIDKLPPVDSTEVFGMHENALITLARKETSEFFNAILQIQPRTAVSQSDERAEILSLSDKILTYITIDFDEAFVLEKYPVVYEQSMNTVLIQELGRFNVLTRLMKSSLSELNDAMAGVMVITSELEQLLLDLLGHKVPEMWAEVAYLSQKPLLAWVVDLQARLRFFYDWVHRGPPSVYWISGFFSTQSFLTGTLQNYARKTRLPIDSLSFDIEVCSDIIPVEGSSYRKVQSPEDGCYINGLFLEGAAWNATDKILQDPPPRVLFSPMYTIWLKPTNHENLIEPEEGQFFYNCPIYKTSLRAGELTTSGQSSNFVLAVNLPTTNEEKHWVKRGCALLTQLDD